MITFNKSYYLSLDDSFQIVSGESEHSSIPEEVLGEIKELVQPKINNDTLLIAKEGAIKETVTKGYSFKAKKLVTKRSITALQNIAVEKGVKDDGTESHGIINCAELIPDTNTLRIFVKSYDYKKKNADVDSIAPTEGETDF